MRTEHHHHPANLRVVFTIFAESFKSEQHLRAIVTEAQRIEGKHCVRWWRVGNERQVQGGRVSAVSVRISQFRYSAACHVSALALWDRRSGALSVFLGRPSP